MDDQFHPPPWDAPLDVAACIAAIPSDDTIKGLFILPMLVQAQHLGISLKGARDRYLPFSDYPLAEHARLLVESAQAFFPNVSTRQALRKLGRAGQRAFVDTTLGKVVWSGAVDVGAALASIAKGYALTSTAAAAKVVEQSPGRARIRLDGVRWFLDSHHVGLFEGVVRACDVMAEVSLRLDSPSAGEFLITWPG